MKHTPADTECELFLLECRQHGWPRDAIRLLRMLWWRIGTRPVQKVRRRNWP